MPSVDSSTAADTKEESPEMMCPHLRKLAAQKESSKEEKTIKSPAEDKQEIKGGYLNYYFLKRACMVLGH